MNKKPLPACVVCGKLVKLRKNKTCSTQCREQLKKNNNTLNISLEKKKNTMLKKYGVKNPSQSAEIIQKRKNTMLKKYGAMVSPKARKQAKENAQKLNENVEQIFKSKYGISNPSQLPTHKSKCTETLLKNYGVTNYFKSNKWKEKSLEKMLQYYSEENSTVTILDILDPCNKLIEDYEHPNKRIKYKCNICNYIDIIPTETFKFRNRTFNTVCSKCSNISTKTSNEEKQIVDYIKSIYPNELRENDRKLIHPYELDIVIPNTNIAIEYCGLFWHSKREKEYHLDKLEKCNKIGYRLITIFQDEWLYKKDIVKNRIKNMLKVTEEKIYARCCCVREINAKDARDFVNSNHIQGYINSKIKLGLFNGDKLIAVMTFSKPSISKGRHKDFNSWEISRFCSSINVIGGASKLFQYFVRTYNVDYVFSYSDRRWDTGNLYTKMGFKFEKNTKPNYWYIKGDKRIHRFSLRKNETDNPSLTEWENRKQQGWNRIWDCGHSKWVWVKP